MCHLSPDFSKEQICMGVGVGVGVSWVGEAGEGRNSSASQQLATKTLQRLKKKLFPAECTLLCVAGVGVTVVLDHPEEALLLVGVLGEAVEEEAKRAKTCQ